MRWRTGIALALLASGAANAVPMPPPRPAEVGSGISAVPTSPPPAPSLPPMSPGPPAAAGSCLDALRAAGLQIEAAPQPAPTDARCAVADPVHLLSLPGRGTDRIALPDHPVFACALAGPFATWATQIAAPVLADAHGARLAAIRTGPGFECRGRNRQEGAKLSAHGSGLALDLASFVFADGATVAVRDPTALAPAIAAIRRAACGWFTTVLGPGSDPFHTDHLHLDIQLHGTSDRYRICQ